MLVADADCASYEALHPALLGGPFSKGRRILRLEQQFAFHALFCAFDCFLSQPPPYGPSPFQRKRVTLWKKANAA